MPALLHIWSSPRGGDSASVRVAEEFIKAFLAAHSGWRVDRLDLFAGQIPEFLAPQAAAKYSVMAGEEPKDAAAVAWKQIIGVIDRFKSADAYLFSVPMWNFSIPYRLKQYIDVIVQPGLTFSFDPAKGYSGLVMGKPAVLVLARGGAYSTAPAAAMDMQKTYMQTILGFIGFTDIRTIVAEPTLAGGPEAAKAAVEQASAQARQLAAEILK
ncbi:MAG: NAD(P)H-dependent oxidoreductase [Planctomycetes bacterium]|nr:NAD(P)H-dependent oxidoreductase [Planctomycetota bacterium]